MLKVIVQDGESIDKALKRFKRNMKSQDCLKNLEEGCFIQSRQLKKKWIRKELSERTKEF